MHTPYGKSLTATVYIVKADRVLLHLHKKFHTWFPVGGHLEKDELPHVAALREVKEECGLDVTLLDARPQDTSLDLGRVVRVPSPLLICHEGIGHDEEFLDLIYVAVTDQVGAHSQDGESHTFRWFSEEELRDPAEDLKIHVRTTALAALKFSKTE